MGNNFMYHDESIGEITLDRWKLMRQLVRILIEYLNHAMLRRPGSGIRNLTVSPHTPSIPSMPIPVIDQPPIGALSFEAIFADRSDWLNEIEVLDPTEWRRFFAWYQYVAARDGALDMFEPMMQALYRRTSVLEDY